MPGHYQSPPPPPPLAPKPKQKKHKNRPAPHPQDVNQPVPGTGSRYNKDGSKKDLGVGWGPLLLR